MRGERNWHTSFDAEKISSFIGYVGLLDTRHRGVEQNEENEDASHFERTLNAWPQTAGDNKAVPCTI
jgi:hypothetical protein